MDKVLDTYNLWRLNAEDMENLNRSTMGNEIEGIIKGLPTKSKAKNGFDKTSKSELCGKGRDLPNSVWEALMPCHQNPMRI